MGRWFLTVSTVFNGFQQLLTVFDIYGLVSLGFNGFIVIYGFNNWERRIDNW